MKRYTLDIIVYITSVICLALFIAGGVLLTAGLPRAHIHEGEYVTATEATCVYAGNTEYWHCQSCGKYFADELLTEQIPQADTVIARLPHTEEVIAGTPATCTASGISDGIRCAVCENVLVEQQVTDPIPHTEEVIAGTPATCIASGISDGKRCTVCENVLIEQQVIDALGHDPDFVEETQSTCSVQGNPDYYHCGRCEGNFAEEQCTTALTEEQLLYPFANHTYKQCFNNTRHYMAATCGHELEKDSGEHNFTNRICSDCGFYNCYVEYTLNEDGTAYIVTDRTSSSATDVVICSEYNGLPVTEIAKDAFGDDRLIGVSIPASVTKISESAFNRCYNLETITVNQDNPVYESKGNCLIDKETRTLVAGCKTSVIPDDSSVISIGNRAFYRCEIAELTIPYSVTHIGVSAFYMCEELESITLSERLATISSGAFYYCTALTEITLPASVKTIDANAFYGCSNLASINIPRGVTVISNYTFYNCESLTSITIPASVERIENDAFDGCTSLEEVNFSVLSNLTYIASYSFGFCTSLKKLYIPASVINVSPLAFYNCSGLEEITASLNNSRYMSANNCLIEKSNHALVLCCNTSVIPNDGSVTRIGQYAFPGLQLTTLHIPANITVIQDYAFCGLPALAEITVDPANGYYFAKDNCLIEKSGKKLILGCKNSVIPDDGSVTKINDYAFRGCTELTDLAIPASVKWIGNLAFFNTDIKNLYIEDLKSWLNVEFEKTNSPAGLNPLQKGGNIYVNGELLTELTIPDGVTEVSEYAFKNCLSLTKIVIPDHVTKVAYYAFSGCGNVTEFILGDGVTERVYLKGLKNLETLSLGNGLTEIAMNEFMSQKLTSVTLGDNITEIGTSAFANCRNLTEVVLPANLQTLGRYAFYYCTNLTKITIGGNVTEIPTYAFRNCTSLTDIYFDGTKEQWFEIAAEDWDYNTGEYTIHFNDGTTMQKGEE